MRIRTSSDIAALAREARTDAGITQQGLAERAQVSRRWVADFESGKPGVELGKVLRVLAVLGIELDTPLRPAPPPERSALDEHLDNYQRRTR